MQQVLWRGSLGKLVLWRGSLELRFSAAAVLNGFGEAAPVLDVLQQGGEVSLWGCGGGPWCCRCCGGGPSSRPRALAEGSLVSSMTAVGTVWGVCFLGLLFILKIVWLSHGALCDPASYEQTRDAGDEPEILKDVGGDTPGS